MTTPPRPSPKKLPTTIGADGVAVEHLTVRLGVRRVGRRWQALIDGRPMCETLHARKSDALAYLRESITDARRICTACRIDVHVEWLGVVS